MCLNKDYIGIIIPNSDYDLMPKLSHNLLSMFRIWEETAEKHHLTLCYFRLFDIKPERSKVKAYVKEKNKYLLKQIPSPNIIYSRVLDHLPKNQSHLKFLVEAGKTIFNIPNYDIEKHKIHELLISDTYIRNHVPDTELFTVPNLNNMASTHNELILKKNYGEFGIGAMKLERFQGQWCLSYKSQREKKLKKISFKKTLPAICQKRLLKHTYIIQEIIPLATYNGNPFDMRVALQKNIQGKFQVSAIMCKVAEDEDFLTNGAQGGTAYTLKEIAPYSHPSIPYQTLVDNISRFSLYTANYLDKHFTKIGDLGFDVGITKDGIPYFIECNFISDYETGLFKNGRLIYKEWKDVISTPIEYATFLLNHSK